MELATTPDCRNSTYQSKPTNSINFEVRITTDSAEESLALTNKIYLYLQAEGLTSRLERLYISSY